VALALALPASPAIKWCYDCRRFKPIDAFAFADKAKGTRQGRCRECHATYRRQHYIRNRDTYIKQEVARIRRYRDENRPLIREYLRAHPCVDCGEADIVVLDFDHRDPAAKRYNVTLLAAHKSWTRVMAEIEKCDVRCSNCHRRRTALQFDWGTRGRRAPKADAGSTLGQDGKSEPIPAADLGEKTCGKCGLAKPLWMFPFKNKELGRRGSTCLACMAAYSREHYARNRAKYLEKAHRSRSRVRAKNDERLLAYLLDHPCVDCGETDPLVLDFDHREPSLKSDEVSRMVYHRPWRVVLEEIEKCDVRCANCHRRKTARQFGWSKLELPAALTILPNAGVAQLVERDFPKVEVAGSCPVSRSEKQMTTSSAPRT
jgi:hypothetical protein